MNPTRRNLIESFGCLAGGMVFASCCAKSTKTISTCGSKLIRVTTPNRLDALRALIPQVRYFGLKNPKALVHREHYAENPPATKEAQRRYFEILTDYVRDIELANCYLSEWRLSRSCLDLLEQIYQTIVVTNRHTSVVYYDTSSNVSHPNSIIGIDLVGGRQGNAVFNSPLDWNGPLTVIPNTCIDLISKLNQLWLRNVFFNYGQCDLEHFLRSMKDRSGFDILGVPVNVTVDSLNAVLSHFSVSCLDLSGTEHRSDVVFDLLRAALRSSVNWVLVSDYSICGPSFFEQVDWSEGTNAFIGAISPHGIFVRNGQK